MGQVGNLDSVEAEAHGRMISSSHSGNDCCVLDKFCCEDFQENTSFQFVLC